MVDFIPYKYLELVQCEHPQQFSKVGSSGKSYCFQERPFRRFDSNPMFCSSALYAR